MDENKGNENSALFVMDGVKGGHDGLTKISPKKFRKKNEDKFDILQFSRMRFVLVIVLLCLVR